MTDFKLGHGVDLHVAVRELPLVIGFEQDGFNEPDDAVFVRENTDDVRPALHLLFKRSKGLVE